MLDKLFAGAANDAALREAALNYDDLEVIAREQVSAIDAVSSLSRGPCIKVIAEIKRRSPSKGHLSDIKNPAELAKTYAENGASAISVLTEQHGFGGSLNDLLAVRAAVEVPVLRKDFISNEYQILEARAAGADMVLLILAWLDHDLYRRLLSFTESLGMTALVETHDADEVARAVDSSAVLIGINTRNLQTFETDMSLFGSLVENIPNDRIRIAESSVRSLADVEDYRSAGADCVLIGEALVKGNAAALLQEFSAVQ